MIKTYIVFGLMIFMVPIFIYAVKVRPNALHRIADNEVYKMFCLDSTRTEFCSELKIKILWNAEIGRR